MKKLVVFLLAFAMVTAFAACGANDEESFVTITAKGCFGDAGYVQLYKDGVSEPCELTFTAEDSENVEWSVYVLDEEFEDGFRYIAQSTEPVLVGDGTISVEAGQYVYVYCSAHEFTNGVADENATLKVTAK